jgi:hypothetical protein
MSEINNVILIYSDLLININRVCGVPNTRKPQKGGVLNEF